MDIRFPNKEEFAQMFSEEEIGNLPEGVDIIELCDVTVQAFKIAVEEFPLEDYKPIEGCGGSEPHYFLDPQFLKNTNVPSVMLTTDEEGFPLLYLRIFTKDGSWLGEGVWNGMNAAGFFVGKALSLINELKSNGSIISDEDQKEFLIRKTANMLQAAFSNIKNRLEITVNSYLEEVWWDWAEIWYEHHAEFNSLQGFQMKRLAFAKAREKQIEKHKEEICALWKDESSGTLFDLKKQLLALKYRTIYEHWKEMERMQLEGKNWHRYVKAGDMSDIDDDLIEDFERGADLSGIAIEHAARQAELYNIFDVREKRLEKRRRGIRDSGYSRSRLFELKKEGEEMLENRRKTSSPPPDEMGGLENNAPVHWKNTDSQLS